MFLPALVGLLFPVAAVDGGATPAVLHDFISDAETVTIAVTDCGCTKEEDFAFVIQPEPKGQREVTVIRVRVDHCEAVPLLVEFVFPRKAIKLQGAKAITVTNNIQPFRGDPADCGQ